VEFEAIMCAWHMECKYASHEDRISDHQEIYSVYISYLIMMRIIDVLFKALKHTNPSSPSTNSAFIPSGLAFSSRGQLGSLGSYSSDPICDLLFGGSPMMLFFEEAVLHRSTNSLLLGNRS
jgi:hypothetical protein